MKKPVLPKYSQECILCNCNEINDRIDNACFIEDSITDDLYQQEFFECEFKNVSIHSKMISCLLLGTGENRQKVSSENRHFQSIKNSQS